MAERSPYQVLGVAEDASFEEIQAVKNQRIAALPEDEEQQEAIEQAYDLILMQRLRLRQEGKIAVPDRIRYAERAQEREIDANKKITAPGPRPQAPGWLGRLWDPPNTNQLLLSTGIFGGLTASTLVLSTGDAPTLQLALGLLAAIWLLHRKERRAIRSTLLALGSLTAGYVLALGIASALPLGGSVAGIWLVAITFSVMWLVTLFLR